MKKIREHIKNELRKLDENEVSDKVKDELSGGYGDNKHPNDFDPWELGKGVQIEMEHTNDLGRSVEVAMDHLTEIPDYYSRLEKMENEAEND